MDAFTDDERNRLSAFLGEMLAGLGRSERRNWGSVYVRGLLSTGGRKAAATMADHLPDGNVQALQQFIGQSPWPWEPVRRQLADRLVRAMDPPAAWIVDDTGFPKKGSHSVGVARQYSGTLGKVGNCQVAVSLHYATDELAAPLDFALYLPEEWLSPQRRREASIPEDVVFRPKWQLALDLIDRARSWAVPDGVVTADSGYGNTSEFRAALAERGLPYVVAIQETTGLFPDMGEPAPPPRTGRRGRPRAKPEGAASPISAAALAKSWPEARWQQVMWRLGSKGPLQSRFAAARVLPAHGYQHGGSKEGVCWLLVEWPEEAEAPSDFWLADLPEETGLVELVRLAKLRWWIEQGYRQLKDELGLDHYEGRSWQGWHHHVTLTMMAFGFLLLESLHRKKNFWVEAVSPEGEA